MADNCTLKSDGSFSATIDGTATEVVHGNKKTWTQGNTLEMCNGNKTFKIHGRMEEFFLAVKWEQVIGAETKQNFGGLIAGTVGHKTNIVAGGCIELDKSKKFHLAPSGHGWIASERKIQAAEEEELAVKYLKKVSSEFVKVTEFNEKIGNLNTTVDNMSRKAEKMSIRVITIGLKATTFNEVRGSYSQSLSGALKVNAGDFNIKATGDLKGEGSPVRLVGEGSNMTIDGGVTVKRVKLTM